MSTIINQFFSGNFHFVAPISGGDEDKMEISAKLCQDDDKKDVNNNNRACLVEYLNSAEIGEKNGNSGAEFRASAPNSRVLLPNENLVSIPNDSRKKLRAKSQKRSTKSAVKLEDALRHLHQRIGRLLKLGPGAKCIDIGCGIGGVMLDLADSGAHITGLTCTPSDVQMGNEMFRQRGYDATCRIVEAACEQKIPLDAQSQDAAYAIYALKYFPRLAPVLAETARVLRHGGLFAVYDLVKNDRYDENNPEHRAVLEAFEFSCGMPRLHTRAETIERAAEAGLRLVSAVDIDGETGLPFHYCFSNSAIYMWLMRSKMVGSAIRALEWLRVLPKGFHKFNKTFLAGTVDKIVTAGEMGILSGGEILLFEKQ